MTSPLLALFTRSLREDTRSRTTYWARGGLTTFVLLILLVVTAISQRGAGMGAGAPGLMFFSSIISLQVACITLLGLSFFASAITEEKEEETLGLLRMTNLNPLSILLGKSTSRLCSALLLLVALLPFTLLAITLGGVSIAQILAAYCTLGAYTFLLCNVALLWSVIAPNTARAVLFTIASLVVFFTANPLLKALQNALVKFGVLTGGSAADVRMDGIISAAFDATPIARIIEIFNTGFSDTPAGWQVWTNLALGLACFFIAWLVFARLADRAAESASAASPRRRFFGIRFRRPPRPWKNALAWKDFHFLSGGRPGFVLRLLGYGGVAAWLLISGASASRGGLLIITNLADFAFPVELALVASRIFRTELSGLTWSSLALLPLSLRQIARRKLLGGLLATVPSAVLMVLATGLQILRQSAQFPDELGLRNAMLVSTVSSWVTTAFTMFLIAFLSLLMKRGALALGVVITYALMFAIHILSMLLLFSGSYFSSSTSNMALSMMAGPIVTGILSLIAIFVLYRTILKRLEIAAAEN